MLLNSQIQSIKILPPFFIISPIIPLIPIYLPVFNFITLLIIYSILIIYSRISISFHTIEPHSHSQSSLHYCNCHKYPFCHKSTTSIQYSIRFPLLLFLNFVLPSREAYYSLVYLQSSSNLFIGLFFPTTYEAFSLLLFN